MSSSHLQLQMHICELVSNDLHWHQTWVFFLEKLISIWRQIFIRYFLENSKLLLFTILTNNNKYFNKFIHSLKQVYCWIWIDWFEGQIKKPVSSNRLAQNSVTNCRHIFDVIRKTFGQLKIYFGTNLKIVRISVLIISGLFFSFLEY